MKATSIHVLRLNPLYWYAEVRGEWGARLQGRSGFESELSAREWATQWVQSTHRPAVDPLAAEERGRL